MTKADGIVVMKAAATTTEAAVAKAAAEPTTKAASSTRHADRLDKNQVQGMSRIDTILPTSAGGNHHEQREAAPKLHISWALIPTYWYG